MPRGILRRFCKVCDRHVDECGSLSARGKCKGCADWRVLANHDDLRHHRGPFFDHWRRRSLAALGVSRVDVDEPSDVA